MKVICWVKMKNGKSKRFKSRDGKNFKDRKGNSYTAPVAEKNEILEYETFWGRKMVSFYKEGQETAIPVSRDSKWKETTNHDNDVDTLIRVTRAALMEANMADLKANLNIAGLGAVILGLVIHHFWG